MENAWLNEVSHALHVMESQDAPLAQHMNLDMLQQGMVFVFPRTFLIDDFS